MRAIAALARADLLERARRMSFLITLAFVLWLGIGTFDGSVSVDVGGTQGVPNAAWVGGMMSLVAITFLTLAGFWVVKNAVDRDERTGVGPILATTPLSRVQYTLGKALSHLLVLVTLVAMLALCGVVLFALRGGGTRFDPFAFLVPFVLCVTPALALTAALAILFETTPGLRGGAANALWLFGWGGLFLAALSVRNALLDPWGLLLLQQSMAAAAQAQLGVDPSQFSVQLNPGRSGEALPTFLWTGVAWTVPMVLSRVAWLAIAVGVAALAAVPFHRFDPSRRRRRIVPAAAPAGADTANAPARARLRDTTAALLGLLPAGIVGSELRLLLGGANLWWWIVASGLFTACWLAPLPAARSGVLLAAWLWPLLRWSQLGSRDARNGTEAFVLSAPRALARQLPAAWLAGVLLAAIIGLGVGARLVLAGDWGGFVAWGAGALFIPAMALALGLLSRGTRLFEVLYTILWYLGPAHRTSALDFMGVTGTGQPTTWLLATAVFLAVAVAVRARQVRG